ncbi:MAG: hypothetical protein MW690_001323 [Methanophagales archaeon]|nr:hypothetical protein [Methanophagales archaeon]
MNEKKRVESGKRKREENREKGEKKKGDEEVRRW